MLLSIRNLVRVTLLHICDLMLVYYRNTVYNMTALYVNLRIYVGHF